MKPAFQVEVVHVPSPTASEDREAALDLLADALAERSIRESRDQVAARLGVEPDQLDRQNDRKEVSDSLSVLSGRSGGAR